MTVNVTYREAGAVVPGATTIKNSPLSNGEIDGNFKSVKDAVEVLSTGAGASLIGVTPVGDVAATTVQGAIAELDSEKASLAALVAADGSTMVGYTPAGTGAAITTVQDELRQKVNVLDFYANGVSGSKVDPTGVIESTAGIQNAVEYARSIGTKTIVPGGTYLIDAVTSIIMHDNAWLEMSPNATLVVKPNNKGYSVATSYAAIRIIGSNVTVSGGKIKGDRELHDYSVSPGNPYEFGHGIYIIPSTKSIKTIRINNVFIEDCVGDSILSFGVNSGGTYYGSSDVIISGCTLADCRRNNIAIGIGDGTTVENCRIINAGISKYGIDGCDPKSGLDIEGGSNPRKNWILNNYFDGNIGGNLILYNANETVVSGNIFIDYPLLFQVSSNIQITGNTFRTISSGAPGASITQTTSANTAAGPGTMLAVGARYKILARTTIDFTTVGAADNNTGTEFIAQGRGPLGTGDSVLRIPENIYISSNHIIGGANGIQESGTTRNVVIVGNNLRGQITNGIYIGSSGSSATESGAKVISNSLKEQAIGIRIGGKECFIANNIVDTCTSRAIYAAGTAIGGAIARNNIRDPSGGVAGTLPAIDISGGAWTIHDNVLALKNSLTVAVGIGLNTANNKVSGNKISGDCLKAGISFIQKQTITGNQIIELNAPDGILSTSSTASNSVISENYIESIRTSGTNYGIRFTGGGTGIKIVQNKVFNTVFTFTKAIDTSANTDSKIAANITDVAGINANASDTVTNNISV